MNVLTSLTLSRITIDGSSVHLKNIALSCPTPNKLCCPISSYENFSTICAFNIKKYQRDSDNSFEGFFLLNGINPQLLINDFHFMNFYAIYEYNSLIFDSNQTSNITLNAVLFENVYFLKGLFYIDILNPKSKSILFTLRNTKILK